MRILLSLCVIVYKLIKYVIKGIFFVCYLILRIFIRKPKSSSNVNENRKLEESQRKLENKKNKYVKKIENNKDKKQSSRNSEKRKQKLIKEEKRLKKQEEKLRLRLEKSQKRALAKALKQQQKQERKAIIEARKQKEIEERKLKEEQNKIAKAEKVANNQEVIDNVKTEENVVKNVNQEENKISKEQEADIKKAKKEEQNRIKAEQKEAERQRKIQQIREKNRLKEEESYRIAKEKEAKRQERLRRREEKRALKEEKKKNKETYINKNVKIEKPGIGAKFSEFVKKVKKVPKKIGNKLKNNSFAKNARNKRDINRQALLIDFEGEDAKKSDVKLVYKYEAKDSDGKFVKGRFEAYSRVEVHSFLLSEGYEVYSIKTNKWITFLYGGSSTNKVKFKNKDLIFFLAQLSTYLKAGITLIEALKILSRQFDKKKKYEKIFKSIIYELTMGESFSSALEKQNVAFPSLLINMVKTAEMTGELPEVLDNMVDYYTEIDETKRQFVTAMTYPTIVFIFAMAVITFILVWVVPKFYQIYESMDEAKIPAFTMFVMRVSNFLKSSYIWIFLTIFIVITVYLLLYKKKRFFRTINQWIFMHIPAIGPTIIYSEVATFTKTFASLLSHNVPITECMEILNKITNNEIYKMLILDVVSNLAKGGKVSDAFEGHWAFPIPAYEMICTGERTGELPDMLNRVSIYYQSLQKSSVTRIKTFIEPILTVFLTVIVGAIILAIIVPMFNLYQAIQTY